MEIIRIHDNISNIVLYLNKNNYFGYKFNNDNTIEKVDKKVFKYFDFLVCSNNYKLLPDENNDKVILDNETNFKHYFKDNCEDYLMFCINNGRDALLYISDNDNIKKRNNISFLIGNLLVTASLSAFLLASSYVLTNKIIEYKKNYEISLEEEKQDKLISLISDQDITIPIIVNAINNSNELTDREKEFLINSNFIIDTMEYINLNNYTKADILNSIDNIDIKSFGDEDDINKSVVGYYDESTPNAIYARDYVGIDVLNKDTIAHEFIHLFQAKGTYYNLITEASAEIISAEYYNDCSINAYYEQVRQLKILMEIIGPEPIWHYNFTGDFSMIEERVKPNLSNEDYKIFMDCLIFDYDNYDDKIQKIASFKEVLNNLYKNIYNADIKNDAIINLINNNDKTLCRYYFNKKYINKYNSYCYVQDLKHCVILSKEEAILNDYVFPYIMIKQYIDPEDYNEISKHEIIHVENKYIDDFKWTTLGFNEKGTVISGYLNDEYLSNVPADELKERGILLESKYYYYNGRRKLSKEEYFNQEYEDTDIIDYYYNDDYCVSKDINSDNLRAFLPSKVELPTINERFNNIENNKIR